MPKISADMRQVEGSESKKIKPPLKNNSSNTGAKTKAVRMKRVLFVSVDVCFKGKKDKRIEKDSISAQPNTVSFTGGALVRDLKFNPAISAAAVYSVYFITVPNAPAGVNAVPKTMTATAARMRQYRVIRIFVSLICYFLGFSSAAGSVA